MNIVIIGDGKVGSTLSSQLQKEGHDIVVIDNNQNALKNLINTQDVMCVEGNGALYEVQEEAGVPNADLVIACTSMDELNMLCCLLSKKLGAKKTIARVRDPQYFKQLNIMKEELGLSMGINPELAAATEISRIMLFPAAAKIELFAKGKVELVEFKLAAQSMLDGMSLSEVYKKYKVKVLVCAVQRDGEIYIPDGDFRLRSGDKINLTASHENIEKFFHTLGLLKDKSKTAIIVGGGKIAYYLTIALQKIGVKVKIIEKNYQRCMELSDLLPKASIIHGDGTDQDLLKEEGLEQVDAFASLTGIDEENIIMAMFASSLQVPKVAAKINRDSYAGMADMLGLESFVSPKNITANHIVSYVRAMQNSLGSNIETLYRLVDNQVEALEFIAREDGPYIGVPLKDLRLKKNLLIASIVRRRIPIIPGGNDKIEIGDSVIVVSRNQQLKDLKEILQA
ncbi:MAG: Trk system potassium transporter TrkA [Ruminococcaceae bacterium]|nr:Trk system potassium transporter TrkA [Oscillospiraceae bacterium]